MDPTMADLVRPAMGEIVLLGQLYTIGSHSFISENLWAADQVKRNTSVVPVPRTEVTFKQTASIDERSKLLDLSASVTINVAGMVGELSGKAAYLQRSDSRKEDTNITAAIRVTTQHESLDIQQMMTSTMFSPAEINQMSATHVLTGITYGGTYLGSITQRASRDKSKTNISGNMSISILQQASNVLDFSGEGSVKVEKDRYATDSSISVSVVSDINQDDEGMTPMAVLPFLESLPKATKGLEGSKGVPQTFILTPLKVFNKFSTEVFFQDLVESELQSLVTFYDDLKSLYQDRKLLSNELDTDTRFKYFPSFNTLCTSAERTFQQAYNASNAELRRFLADYRLHAATETTQSFLTKAQLFYDKQYKLLREDQGQANLLLKLVDLSAAHGYPMVTWGEISSLETLATANHDNAGVLILIPENTSRITLLDSFRNVHDLLDLASLSVSTTSGSQCRTYYLDASNDENLLRAYEKPSGTLQRALSIARNKKSAVVIQSKYSLLHGTPDWQIFGDLAPNSASTVLPGVLTDSMRETRYVGGIKDGLAHGTGNIAYRDGSTYQGGFFLGDRDGYGQIGTPAIVRNYDNKTMEGTEGMYAGLFAQNYITDRTDYRLQILAKIYVESKATAYSTPIFASNNNAKDVVAKIAKHFDWRTGQRFRLTTLFSVHQASSAWPFGTTHDGTKIWKSVKSLIIDGKEIEVYPYPEESPNAWPDEELDQAISTPGFHGRISQAQRAIWNEHDFSLPIEIMVEAL